MKRKIAFKLLSAIMAFALFVGIVAPTANVFASHETANAHNAEKEKFNYVSLGASNVNGYGMYGYVDEWAYDYPLEKANQNVYGYKSDTPNSYPVLIADKLSQKYDVTLSQLAISSMRAEEIRFLLYDDAVADKYTKWRFYNEDVANVDYSDNWFVSAGWREMGYNGVGAAPSHKEALAALRAEYQNALTEADLITVDVGMNNFGVYLQKEIKSPGHFGSDLAGLDPDVAAKYAKGKEYVINIIEDALDGSEIPEEFLEFAYNAADAMAYALVGYCLAFDDIMAWIYENNPDADVVVVSVTNLMHGVDATIPGTDAKLPLGDIFGAIINAANTYTATLSPYAYNYSYANVSEGGHIELFGDEVRDYNGNPSTICKDLKDCFDVYDNSLFLKTQVQKVFATELANAGVLQMHDVQKGMDETGLITYYNGFHYDYQSNMGPMGDYWHIKMFVGTPYEMYYKDFLNFMAYRSNRDLIIEDADLAEQKANYFGESFDKETYVATIEAKIEALEPVLASMEVYYAAYEQSLNIAYDVMAEIMREAAKIDEVNLMYLNVRAGDALLQMYFGTILGAIEAGKGNPSYNFDMAEAYPDGFFDTFAAMMNVPTDAVETFMYFEFAGMIGNSFFAHPNTNGQKEIYDAIWLAYTNDILGSDVVIENVIDIAKQLGDLLVENYDVVYEIAYAELKKNGVIDDLKGKLEGAYSDLISQAEKYESADASSIYAETKIALAAELRATADTVAKIIEIVDQNTVGEHTRILLAELRESVLQHGYVLVNIANELGELSVEYTDQVISDLISAANTAADRIKAAAEEKLADLEAQLHAAEEAAKAAIRAEIAKVKAQLESDLAAINAQVEKQIAIVRAEYEAVIEDVEKISSVAKSIVGFTAEITSKIDETIVNYFRTNLSDVYYKFAQTIVDAAKNHIINGKAENFDEAIDILKTVIMAAVENADAQVKAIIETFIEEAVKVSYTGDEDSYLVSLNGGSAYYAQLLAELLNLGESQIGFTNWENIDYDMLAAADLITIGYDENELSGFAVNQLIGYLANYVDTDVRTNTIAYIAALIDKLETEGVNIGKYESTLTGALESALDEFVAGKEMQDMDWAAIVGAENLHYVDKARADIRAELISSGLMETYVIELNVIDLIYDNVDSLGDPALSQIFKTIGREFVAKIVGDSAIYTIEIPVVDAVVFAAESFLYNYVNFNVNYGKLILELQKINPEASVILLGYYNAFNGLSLEIGDLSVDVGEVYQMFTDITSVQPFLYALYYPNVAYVDISAAETNFEAYVKAGLVDGDLESFLTLYLSDPTVTDISADGQEYVLNQILKALIINCVHEYDNACDVDCNKCGMVRVVPGHVYSNPCDATCNNCSIVRPISGHIYDSCDDTLCNLCGQGRPSLQHTYDGCTDTDCNSCGKTRPGSEHVFNGCVDADCDLCGATRVPGVHVFDDCDDTSCNSCGYIRPALSHAYTDCTDTDCNNCGATREAGEHIYSGCTDVDCDNCGATREASEHEYDSCTDDTCNKCGIVRDDANHKFMNACDKDCDICGETREVSDHVYSDCADNTCNTCGETRTAHGHTVDDCSDTTCGVCGATVETKAHEYGDWKTEIEPTKSEEGKKVRECKNCGHTESEAIPTVSGSSAGLTFAIVIGAIVVADIIAFAVYWFVIQKKTFADIFSKVK